MQNVTELMLVSTMMNTLANWMVDHDPAAARWLMRKAGRLRLRARLLSIPPDPQAAKKTADPDKPQ
jgi:hypothetical protein